MDATRPSNRRLDYSAQRIGRCASVYELRARARLCPFFRSVAFFSARNIVYLYFPFALFPSLSLYTSPCRRLACRGLTHSIGLLFCSVPEEQIAVPGGAPRVDRVRKRVADG